MVGSKQKGKEKDADKKLAEWSTETAILLSGNKYLSVNGLEVLHAIVVCTNLRGADKRPVQWVEHEHDVLC